jgi:hypothetical protein
MRGQRGMSTLGAVLLAGTTGLLTATLLMDWMIVDVHVTEEEMPIHLTIPFPLIVADAAARFIPDEALEEAEVPPELKQQRELVMAAVHGLMDSPDAHYVKVEAEDVLVDIYKEGDTFHVAVDSEDAIVRCNVPIDGVVAALEDWDWETFDPGLVFDFLHAADNGDLVKVETSDGVRVAIKMW